jgi:Flagellar hook-length control protein FliK
MVQALTVEAALLKEVLGPELVLTPGRAIVARVAAHDGSGRGVINIAGTQLEASLPGHLQTGETVRLVVREVHPHQVVLSLQPSPQATAAPVEVPLPGGGRLLVGDAPEREQQGSRGGPGAQGAVALRYLAPALGPLDLRIGLGGGRVHVGVAAAPGEALERLRAAAPALAEALREATGHAAEVNVAARRERTDLYA